MTPNLSLQYQLPNFVDCFRLFIHKQILRCVFFAAFFLLCRPHTQANNSLRISLCCFTRVDAANYTPCTSSNLNQCKNLPSVFFAVVRCSTLRIICSCTSSNLKLKPSEKNAANNLLVYEWPKAEIHIYMFK